MTMWRSMSLSLRMRSLPEKGTCCTFYEFISPRDSRSKPGPLKYTIINQTNRQGRVAFIIDDGFLSCFPAGNKIVHMGNPVTIAMRGLAVWW